MLRASVSGTYSVSIIRVSEGAVSSPAPVTEVLNVSGGASGAVLVEIR